MGGANSMLIVCNNPLSRETKTYQLDDSLTIQQNIEMHLSSGYDYSVFFNGERIDRPELFFAFDEKPKQGDTVVMVRRQGGVDPVSWVYIVVMIVLAAAVYYLAPRPKTPNGIGEYKDSPNNSLTGQTNIARLYQAIPDIYGQIVSYPDLIQEPITEYIDNVKSITHWMCVGLGKYSITDVKYGATDLVNIAGGGYEFFFPAPTGAEHYEQAFTWATNIYEGYTLPEANGQEITLPDFESLPVIISSSEYTGGGAVISCDQGITTINFPEGTFPDVVANLINGGGVCVSVDPPPPTALTNKKARCLSATSTSISFDVSGPNYVHYSLSSVKIESLGNWFEIATLGPFTAPVTSNYIWANYVFQRGLNGGADISAFVELVDSDGYVRNGNLWLGPYLEINNVFSGSTLDQQYRTIKMPNGEPNYNHDLFYRVRFVRKNPDNADSTTQVKVESVQAINYYQFRTFKGVTIARFTISATENATSGTENKFNALVTRHVRTLADTSRAGVSPSKDFSRAIAHEYTVCAGQSNDDLDIEALAAIQASINDDDSRLGEFCYSFDDKDLSLGERIQTIGNCCRVSVYRDGSLWSFVREQAGNGAVAQFDYRNLAASGDSAISISSVMPSDYDGVEVEYCNPVDNKKAFYRLRINDDRTLTVATELDNALKVQLAGCRNSRQAINRAYLEANRLIYQTVKVSDVALSDAQALNIGDVVRWVDPNDFEIDDGMYAGEILEISGTTYKTSEDIDFGVNATGRVMITNATGLPKGPFTCYPVDSNHFRLDSAASEAFVSDGYMVQAGSRYCLMPGVSDSQIRSAGLYILTDKKPRQDGSVEISLVNYDSRVYADD